MVKERLRAAGVLAPAVPAAPDDAEEEIEPAPVDGEPLSQMIIRERR
jgi:hypothetical protein